jgi:hypothetical protein
MVTHRPLGAHGGDRRALAFESLHQYRRRSRPTDDSCDQTSLLEQLQGYWERLLTTAGPEATAGVTALGGAYCN